MPETLAPVQSILVCPTCRSDLEHREHVLNCGKCEKDFAIEDGIPLFEIVGETADFSVQSNSGKSYEHKFTTDATPEGYDEQFVQEPHKKTRTDRELQILNTHLDQIGPVDRILNVPCGGGRLSQPLARVCSLLVEADVALPQVRFAREHGDYDGLDQAAWMTASGFHLPCIDNAFDGVVCARLIHHFSAPEDHRRLLAELCRVAQKFVIISFNDSLSVKAISRKLRGKPNPHTLTAAIIDGIASPHGFTLKTVLSVSPLGSRHRYALLTSD